ncbi:MAG: TerB family tellurite resistance protein [Hyphomicrobiaceae bacterium]
MAFSDMARRMGLGSSGRIKNALDKARALVARTVSRPPKPVQKQVAFTMAFVALAAKMAKADGVAVGLEAEAFERCFVVPENERRNVMRVYELAARDVAGFETYASRIGKMLAEEPTLRRSVFECLFNIAAADGVLHHAEEDFLKKVAEKFDLSHDDYLAVRRLFVRDTDSPYEVLGVDPEIANKDLKAHYLKLVRDNHPDKLVAEGVPREFLILADRKLAAINTAYDTILKDRRSRE